MTTKSPSAANIAFIAFAALFILIAVLSGCATQTIVKVDPMAYCDDGLAPSLLSEPCDGGSVLANGSVFQDALRADKDKNTSLELCRAKVDKLQQAMKTCHSAVVNHNQVIDSLNKK